MSFMCIPVFCDYIRIGEGYEKLVDSIGSIAVDGDIIVISETPISILEGSVVDESRYDYGIMGFLIAEVWCKFFWGYVMALFNYNSRTISNLRKMPVEARVHKEFILRNFGLKHALMPSGDAGVDLSNVPGEFVSLLPRDPVKSAYLVKSMVFDRFGVDVDVLVIDTDPTYCFRGRLFTSIPLSVEGIVNDTGVFGYFLRFFSMYAGATPLASTLMEDAHSLIKYANLAEECQENNLSNFFETIYNMTDTFEADFNEVSDKMLEEVKHIPSVIIRSKYLY
ncbi:MAG: coenzyme F420-0:L-glutamate ligase [Methanosphaera sp.]|nr:coenzyme F420-0:L-glutamate ligase [Methanosphaera sp.]